MVDGRLQKNPRNRAYLVIVQTWQRSKDFLEESEHEMKELTEAAAVKVMGYSMAHVPQPSPSHFIREGKLTEVRDKAKAAGANVLFFNSELTPAQARNIEAFTKIPAVDRTGLILEIFGRRAKTREGKLQVELARLNYLLPRLGGLGGVMSRLGGGVGTRGPGETELEWDRRKIRNRIKRVKEDLDGVLRHRSLLRSGRKKKHFISAVLVGYTNAGKSTLLNSLTGASSYVEDKLFATLDPMTRLQTVNGRHDILFTDTVGFLRDLPHTLIKSFHATLEEVTTADVLIHVLDAAHPKAQDLKSAVEAVLKDIGAEEKPVILALNKADLLTEDEKKRVLSNWPDGILISAKDKLGLQSLTLKIEEMAGQNPLFRDAPSGEPQE
ncbi:MAG TPA: GTPase HflX [Verrucomicrobiae bacterium]|jgi:GTP-binding protein HflX|nr:GTPase HflX [Verrucomicrobiae bacterium]